MGMTVTKKQGGIRVAKKLNVWYTVNKSTPDLWFDRWEEYTTDLMSEIGFSIDSSSGLNKPKRKLWTKQMDFTHPKIGKYKLLLCRKRSQSGGDICLLHKNSSTTIETVKSVVSHSTTHDEMCRTTVGDKILETIRDNWEKQFEPTNEKA
jgi:hypothetical protein